MFYCSPSAARDIAPSNQRRKTAGCFLHIAKNEHPAYITPHLRIMLLQPKGNAYVAAKSQTCFTERFDSDRNGNFHRGDSVVPAGDRFLSSLSQHHGNIFNGYPSEHLCPGAQYAPVFENRLFYLSGDRVSFRRNIRHLPHPCLQGDAGFPRQ